MHVDDLRDASRERLLAEIGALQLQLDMDFSNQVKDLELALLKSRDHSRGLAAQVGELVATNEELTQRLKQLKNAHDRALRSPTWKVGRTILLPLRFLKRFIKAS
jgi:hypothetical protein